MSGESNEIRFSQKAKDRLAWYLTRYPTRQAALLPALRLAQEEFGHLTHPVMDYVAGQLELPPVTVYEAATFYTMYHKKPVGEHCVYVCTNVTCFLKGADQLLEYLSGKLGIRPGQATADGKITLFSVECLGNCDKAPTVQIDDDYHDCVTTESADRLLEKLR
ncbi:MAG: NADH-quinone oxidoreductase subunit NuoE [Candidatus Riflebacteria bacterium]|nr:NADH-quinone oxidoreductase subunit NuoE [Candidatus Riflebacteria bacterium]